MRTVDVIMLSYTKNQQSYEMTKTAIDSLLNSEKDFKFNIFLIETNTEYHKIGDYNCNVLTPGEKFNYNRFMNIGLRLSTSDYVVLANNDVIFRANWFTNMMKMMEKHNLDSASPYCKNTYKVKKHSSSQEVHIGYGVCQEIFGWCIVAKKSVFDKIGFLDETFDFYMQDEDYARQIKFHNLKHGLVPSSHVDHLMSKSHNLVGRERLKEMTNGSVKKFEDKYNLPKSNFKFI